MNNKTEKELSDELYQKVSSLCSINLLKRSGVFKREVDTLMRVARRISLRASNPYYVEDDK